jgi:hypothetical protein
MSTWYLLNETIVDGAQGQGPVRFFPGQYIDDTQIPTAGILAAGGILWPSSDTVVAAAAALVMTLKNRGQGQSAKLSDMMFASAFYSLAGGSGGALEGPSGVSGSAFGPIAATVATAISKKELTLGFAQLTTVGLSQSFNVGTALPANSRILSTECRLTSAFSGGAIASMKMNVGISGRTTDIFDALDILTSAGNFSSTQASTGGVDPFAFYASSSQLVATVTATGADVNAATAGALVLDVLYTVLP